MIVAAGLIASRFVHYAALTFLFGAAFFPVYTYRGMASASSEAAAFFLAWRRALIAAAIAALVSGILWLGFVAANMSGEPSALYDANILWEVIRTTDFGQIWAPRLGLIGLLVVLLLPKRPSETLRLAVIGCAAIALTSIADTGHAGADNSSSANLHIVADAAHLLAAAVWIGALAALARLVMIASRRLRHDELKTLHDALSRFSGIGPIVVATLIVTGLINPGFSATFKTVYGQVLLVKLALVGAMLLLAAANRFWLTSRLSAMLNSKDGLQSAVAALRMSILVETALAVCVLAAVAWMGTLAPAT